MLSALLLALAGTTSGEAVAEPPPARWKRIPSVYERALAYPEFASARGAAGQATLRCRINSLGMPVQCSIHAETPAGYGFGKAVMSLRSEMRFYPPDPAKGPWVLITLNFDPDPKKALSIH